MKYFHQILFPIFLSIVFINSIHADNLLYEETTSLQGLEQSSYLSNSFPNIPIYGTKPFIFNSQRGNSQTQTKEEIQLRRNMLDFHQALGLLTSTSWLATNLVGENAMKDYRRVYEPYAYAVLLTNPFQDTTMNYLAYQYILQKSPVEYSEGKGILHTQLAYTTFSLYAITAGLAFFHLHQYISKKVMVFIK